MDKILLERKYQEHKIWFFDLEFHCQKLIPKDLKDLLFRKLFIMFFNWVEIKDNFNVQYALSLSGLKGKHLKYLLPGSRREKACSILIFSTNTDHESGAPWKKKKKERNICEDYLMIWKSII